MNILEEKQHVLSQIAQKELELQSLHRHLDDLNNRISRVQPWKGPRDLDPDLREWYYDGYGNKLKKAVDSLDN